MNGAIRADIPASYRPPGRQSADEPAVSLHMDAGPSPWFAEVLGATQARLGTRIEAMVQSIVPDGRGLGETKPSATQQRLGEQAHAAEQARRHKRDALRDAESGDPVRPRRLQDRRGDEGATIRDGTKPQLDLRLTPSGPSAECEPPPLPRSDDGAPAPATPSRAPASMVQPAPVNPVVSRMPSVASALENPAAPLPETLTSAPAIEFAAAGPTDGGLLAEQIGDLLGARSTLQGAGRTESVHATQPVGPAESARREASGSSRPMHTPKPPPSRSPVAHETTTVKRGTFARLVRSIRTQVGPQVSTARLQLLPPELGRVRIDVRVVQQRMELSIQAQTPEARDVLASRLTELRSALAEQGLTLDRCEIAVPPTEDALSRGGPREDFERRENRHVDAAAAVRSDAGGEPSEGEDTDSASVEAREWEGLGAASEMRLDIRV